MSAVGLHWSLAPINMEVLPVICGQELEWRLWGCLHRFARILPEKGPWIKAIYLVNRGPQGDLIKAKSATAFGSPVLSITGWRC